MEYEIRDLIGTWLLSHTTEAGPRVLRATARLREHVLLVEVPEYGKHGMHMELTLEGTALRGTYELKLVHHGKDPHKIKLQVRDRGKRLVAYPSGHRESWIFARP